MRDFWRAIKYGFKNKKITVTILTVIFVGVGVDTVIPLVYKRVIDLLTKNTPTDNILNSFLILVLIYFALIVSQSIINQLGFFLIVRWKLWIKQSLSKEIFRHLETLSMSYFEKQSTGKIQERISKGVNDLENIIDSVITDFFSYFLYITISLTILFSIDWRFGTIVLTTIPVFAFITLRVSKRLNKIQDSIRDANEMQSAIAVETIANIKGVKSFTSEHKQLLKFSKYLTIAYNKGREWLNTRIKMNIQRFILVDIIELLILAYAGYSVINGSITIGTLVLIMTYLNRSIDPLWYLTRMVDAVQRDLRSVKRVFELMDTRPEIVDAKPSKRLKIKNGSISFRNVGFSYVDGNKILNKINLSIPGGKTLAIVGKSGSGKSTLVKLLLRFHDIVSGSILIDFQNIAGVSQLSLRQKIGVVMQDSLLFNDTVSNNIAYGKPGAKISEIISAAKAANAHEFITKLPDGYKTIVGERGVKLSGGEQQRINIARAILKNPPILVLDEATSSLDSESEQLIQEALWKLIEGRTTIIIAHRLSTVMKADLIVVMDKGKIVEQGTHRDLVNHKGIYSKLFEIQSGGYLK